jgi:hypothetical protein
VCATAQSAEAQAKASPRPEAAGALGQQGVRAGAGTSRWGSVDGNGSDDEEQQLQVCWGLMRHELWHFLGDVSASVALLAAADLEGNQLQDCTLASSTIPNLEAVTRCQTTIYSTCSESNPDLVPDVSLASLERTCACKL